MFFSRQLLTEEEIAEVRKLTKDVVYEDGIRTLSKQTDSSREMKWCLNNVAGDVASIRLGEIIFGAIDRDGNFLTDTAACSSGTPIISRTETGMYYRPHNDMSDNGEYSTTVFLNDPQDYSGGFLRLNIGGKIEEIKLPIGHAITYSTGITHEVSEVTKGTRDVAVFWTKSKYRDPNKRYIYSNVMRAMRRMDPGDRYPKSIEEYNENPYHILNTMITEFERFYPPDVR